MRLFVYCWVTHSHIYLHKKNSGSIWYSHTFVQNAFSWNDAIKAPSFVLDWINKTLHTILYKKYWCLFIVQISCNLSSSTVPVLVKNCLSLPKWYMGHIYTATLYLLFILIVTASLTESWELQFSEAFRILWWRDSWASHRTMFLKVLLCKGMTFKVFLSLWYGHALKWLLWKILILVKLFLLL